MVLNLTHLQYFTLFLVVFTLNISTVCEAQSMQNVTVGFQSSSMLIYSGAWSTTAPNDLDFDGTHMLTQDPEATASFTFTGVAIYFMSPKWPYLVNTAVSVDSGPITLIDLQDHSNPVVGQGAETVLYSVVWGANGLSNTSHNLLISVGANQPYAVVDGLIFTTVSNVSSTTSSSQSPTSNVASSTASATPSSKSKSKSRVVIPLELGSVFGGLGLLAILSGVVWYLLRRRRKKRPNSEVWTIDEDDSTTSMSNPFMSPFEQERSDRNVNWSPQAERLYNNEYLPVMNQFNDGMSAPPTPSGSQPYHTGYENDISSRASMPQPQMTGRMPTTYESGLALRSTPEGRSPSPPPYETDLVYDKVQGKGRRFQLQR